MTAKRILFHGSMPAEIPEPEIGEICSEFGAAMVSNGHCGVLSGPGPLELIVADSIARRCAETSAPVGEHLEWIIVRTDGALKNQLHIGRRIVLDRAFSYGSFARLRTYLVQHSDAIVTVGGQKGVLDIVEKAKLARKPIFPVGRTGGESREQCAAMASRPEEIWFCTPNEFADLSDYNLTARDLMSRIFKTLAAYWRPPPPKVFIVHGHDGTLKYELKDYIQNTLRLGAPIILLDEPSAGRTVIEKLEQYAADCNIAFVLLTPDDYVATASDSNDQRWRARQNAVLELGYFLGKWTRATGRVLLLHKGSIEIPSDIDGVIYISVDAGIKAAGEQIRRELSDWLPA
jgi:predicted nucleotide-binding protein